jgi:iron complex outermembrane receptor protein
MAGDSGNGIGCATRACSVIIGALAMFGATATHAQRASENAVAQALDAFGLTVGREEIGLYSSGSARGFSPVAAGNLRIDGLYFDHGANFYGPSTRVVRSTVVGVGLAAQRDVFAAPTGIVDYRLRVPGEDPAGSVLIGDANYGVAYAETDVETPVIHRSLSMGAGIGYTHNVTPDLSAHGGELTLGAIARWHPTDSIEVVPFWDFIDHRQLGEKPHVLIGDVGFPRVHGVSLGVQPWANWSSTSSIFGATMHFSFGGDWLLAVGVFRALQREPIDYLAFLFNTDSHGRGNYYLNATPPLSAGATSGEVRLSKAFGTPTLRNIVYVRVTGRDSSIQSATGDTKEIGPATVGNVPQIVMPVFNPGPVSEVVGVRQFTPGVAYSGVWSSHAQLTLALQKVAYRRDVDSPGAPAVSTDSSPWLRSGAAAVSISPKLLAYGDYTQGFEEIDAAPDNAVNRNEPVPAQSSSQIDAGLRIQIRPKLQFLGGVFEIKKPYFNVDPVGVFREVGNLRNRGVELSLTGDLTDRLHIVSGVALIQPRVQYQPGATSGPVRAVAVGPVPGYMTTNLEYRPAIINDLTLGVTINTTSSRYAEYPEVSLPAVTTLGADLRYKMRLAGHNATLWLRGYNLTDAYSLTPTSTGRLFISDARSFELSLDADF